MSVRRDGDLAFVPLGGAGEIGMNLNLYRCAGRWLAVDCGLGFGDAATPHVDVMVPDPAFIAERARDLVGLVITHAHEDHIGAVAHLWRRLGCPVFATPFAAALLRRKLADAGLGGAVPLTVVPIGGRLSLPPFDLEWIRVAHSLPEAHALAIRTPHGLVLHTGDWKLDPDPLIGPPTDEAAFARLGEEGVLAMVCDSTNALVEGESGSEADVRASLVELIRQQPGRVLVTCFSTNVARIESIAVAAEANERQVALVGRSLRRIVEVARETGYLRDLPPFLADDEAGYLPDERLVLVCTGSQAERGSALARMAADSHPAIALGEGDTVIFSSRVIPGNERAIFRMQDDIARLGARVVTERDHFVHVSGHPARDELRRLYRLVRPQTVVPVHGEWRHMTEHAALARELGVGRAVLVEDGDLVRLAPGTPEIADSVPVGRLVPEGERLLPLEGSVLAARKRMLHQGLVVGSLVVDGSGRVLAPPQIAAPGLYDAAEITALGLPQRLADAVGELPGPLRRDDDALRDAARGILRRLVGQALGKRPAVELHLVRLAR